MCLENRLSLRLPQARMNSNSSETMAIETWSMVVKSIPRTNSYGRRMIGFRRSFIVRQRWLRILFLRPEVHQRLQFQPTTSSIVVVFRLNLRELFIRLFCPARQDTPGASNSLLNIIPRISRSFITVNPIPRDAR